MRGPVLAGVFTALLAAALPVAAAAEPAAFTPPFRLFLAQGGDLVLRGDYVRVGDSVAFLLPLHADARQHRAQLVTVPASAVDWETTRRYATAVRAARYAAAGGPADFERLSTEVAHALNAIAAADDPPTRLALARRTRQRLLDWTAASHGYRAQEVGEIVALLDAAAASARDRAGDLRLDLIATTAPPHPLPLLPDPDLQEIVARALTASRLTRVPAERQAILRAVVAVLDDPRSRLGADWRAVNRAIAARDLETEARAAARAYRVGVRGLMDRFTAARPALDAIRRQVGPPDLALASLARRLAAAADDLRAAAPPADVRPLHDVLRQALRLAGSAAERRARALQSGDLRAAWDAAAGAAGALLLFDRAAAEFDRVLPQTGPN